MSIKNKFRAIDELKEEYGSRYLIALLAAVVAKGIAERKKEKEMAAMLGINDEDAKPTVIALFKMLREGVKYRIEQERNI